jgi:hypothetical protein
MRDDLKLPMNQILPNIGAVITLSLGLLGTVTPKVAAKLVGIEPIGLTGISEVRATYGGLFVGLGAVCLYSQSPTVFFAVGVACLGAALGRGVSVLVDRSYAPKNLGGLLFEAGMGALLLSGGL